MLLNLFFFTDQATTVRARLFIISNFRLFYRDDQQEINPSYHRVNDEKTHEIFQNSFQC